MGVESLGATLKSPTMIVSINEAVVDIAFDILPYMDIVIRNV